MTKKDLIEQLKQNMPKGLTKLEMARYIYIELGKQRGFDTRFFYGNRKTRNRIYRMAEKAKDNPKMFHNRKTLICVSLSYLYQSILKEFGINCDVVLDEGYDDGHLTPIINLGNDDGTNKRIRADLQLDLEHIQTGMKTKEFGTQSHSYSCDLVDDKELEEIDKKIGYVQDDYRDKDIEEISKEIEGMNAEETLKYILQDERIYSKTNLQGPIEIRKYYGSILNRLAKKYMNKKIYMFTCYREKEETQMHEGKKRDYTFCSYSYEGEEVMLYLFSKKEGRFINVTVDKLAELQEDGLVLGTRPNANGVKLLQRVIQKNVRKSIDNSR